MRLRGRERTRGPDADPYPKRAPSVPKPRTVTVRRDDCPAFDDLRQRWSRSGVPTGSPARVVHAVVDALVDSFFPSLARLEDELEAIEDAVLLRPSEEELQGLLHLRRRLVGLRRVVASQRDLMGRIVVNGDALPGLTDDVQRYFRDVVERGELMVHRLGEQHLFDDAFLADR